MQGFMGVLVEEIIRAGHRGCLCFFLNPEWGDRIWPGVK
jgi:hypothetical protein